MTTKEQRVTIVEFEQFIAQPHNTNRRFELINGVIVEVSPTQRHAYIVGILMGLLYNYLQENPIGWGLPEARYRMPDDDANALLPDLSFVRAVEGRELVEEGPAPYMPDFAVEVKSPDDTILEMREKALYYLKNGSKMVWLIFPSRQQIEVHTAETVHTYNAGDILDGSDVLPGFTVPVVKLFEK